MRNISTRLGLVGPEEEAGGEETAAGAEEWVSVWVEFCLRLRLLLWAWAVKREVPQMKCEFCCQSVISAE